MNAETKLALTLKVIMLDMLGLTLLGLGLAKLQVNLDFLPIALRFENYAWVFVIGGIALMMPTAILIIKFVRQTSPD